MAALIALQKLLKEKHALEAQEKQRRKKRKEQLQLEEEIAAYMTKINVLKAGSSVLRRAASKGSDGIESYFRKGGKTTEALNTDAETFVPHKDGKDEKGQSILGNSDAHFRDGRPKKIINQMEPNISTRGPRYS